MAAEDSGRHRSRAPQATSDRRISDGRTSVAPESVPEVRLILDAEETEMPRT